MKRILHALRYAVSCAYHGFCSGFAYPDWPVHVVSANVSARELASLVLQAAYDRYHAPDAALHDDVLTEAGTALLKREMGGERHG
jgi:hypothetical protein